MLLRASSDYTKSIWKAQNKSLVHTCIAMQKRDPTYVISDKKCIQFFKIILKNKHHN